MSTRTPAESRVDADRAATLDTRKTSGKPVAAVGSVGRMSEINELSNAYVAAYARLSPMMATFLGVPGEQNELDDLSPQGLAQGNELVLSTLRALAAAASTGADDDIAREVLVERLEVERDLYDSGWAHANLNVIASPLQHVRLVFDLMPTDTDDDVAVLARRMTAVPDGPGRVPAEPAAGRRRRARCRRPAGRQVRRAVRHLRRCRRPGLLHRPRRRR